VLGNLGKSESPTDWTVYGTPPPEQPQRYDFGSGADVHRRARRCVPRRAAHHPFYNDVGKLSARGVTVGCNTNNYCPNDPVTREQMAALIVRALGEFNPVTPGSQRFSDVPPANPFYNFIDRMAVLQITLGCMPDHLQYCPDDPVKREQMAAPIIKALGSSTRDSGEPAIPRLPPGKCVLQLHRPNGGVEHYFSMHAGSHALLSKRFNQPRANGRIPCKSVQFVSVVTTDHIRGAVESRAGVPLCTGNAPHRCSPYSSFYFSDRVLALKRGNLPRK